MRRPEEYFQDRVIRILTERGYLVLNCGKKQIFDIVAIKKQTAYPIELKAKTGRYKENQKQAQAKAIDHCQSVFFVIKQSNRKGKMVLSKGECTRRAGILLKRLQIDLEEYLV